jgi:hypothetical protein
MNAYTRMGRVSEARLVLSSTLDGNKLPGSGLRPEVFAAVTVSVKETKRIFETAEMSVIKKGNDKNQN